MIAVLDDEIRMRTALCRLLRAHGYAVESFADGPAFLAALAGHSFACLVLDLHMPGMDGFALLERLADCASHPPVIVITGHDQAGNAERVRRLGGHAYLTKPVDESPLLRAIESVLGDSPAAA